MKLFIFNKNILLTLILLFLYSCSPINKQHGYLLDDVLLTADKINEFAIGKTTKNQIFDVMGSPSIQIKDIDDIWIYLISFKENNVFEEDVHTYHYVHRFVFDVDNRLIEKSGIDQNSFNKIEFSEQKTRVAREAYGITDQLYDAFTRGQ